MKTALELFPFPWCEFLSVDSGKFTGWAHWSSSGLLIACGLARETDPGFAYSTIPSGLPFGIFERPHEGDGKASKGDIITLSRRLERAIMAARCGIVREVQPSTWKGSVPKVKKTPAGVFYPALDAIKRRMTPADHVTFAACMAKGPGRKGVAAGLQNNVLDSIGIGIWHMRCIGLRA